MKKAIFFALLGSVSALSADQAQPYQPNQRPAPAQTNMTPRQAPGQSNTMQPTQNNNSNSNYMTQDFSQTPQKAEHVILDKDVAKSVSDALTSGLFSNNYQNVSFDVNNGVVTLRGYVYAADDKTKVENKIQGVAGVKQVISEITVVGQKTQTSAPSTDKKAAKANSQDYAATEGDKALNTQIRERLSALPNANQDNITLRTTVGIVTIGGKVGKLEDTQLISEEIKQVKGVKSVINKLSVARQ